MNNNNLASKKQRAILAPLVTEKTTQLAQKNYFTFIVRASANKHEIAQEFWELFGSKVQRVNTVRKLAKTGRRGRRKADGKKAYILSAGADLSKVFPKLS